MSTLYSVTIVLDGTCICIRLVSAFDWGSVLRRLIVCSDRIIGRCCVAIGYGHRVDLTGKKKVRLYHRVWICRRCSVWSFASLALDRPQPSSIKRIGVDPWVYWETCPLFLN